jgi:GAF domain-containing protein
MSVPLLMGETLVGVLSLYAPSANAFADDCGRLVQMVAPHIAAAIHAAGGEARSAGTSGATLRLVSNR